MLDPLIILIALLCGFASRAVGMPALIGYLAAGFILHETQLETGDLLQNVADLGVTLLLFTIGLKLAPKDLLMPSVWGTTIIHMAVMQVFFMGLLWLASQAIPELGLDITATLVIAFALTFSSTVFVIQVMQEKGEMSSRHASQAIGILVIQDLAAVIFIATTKGGMPQPEAILLLLLWPLRSVIVRLLSFAGHGELFTLCGLALALGSAQLFELVDIKADLGVLIMGALLAGTQKGKELARNLLQLKDLFLVGFFLTIGMDGLPSGPILIIAAGLGALGVVKSALYFQLMTWLHAPPRTALLSASAMGNYSEFGLVVIAVAASTGWVDGQWASAVSLAIAVSFLFSSPLSKRSHELYRRFHSLWLRFESPQVIAATPDASGARIVVLGMGIIGTGAYDAIAQHRGQEVLGVDLNERKLKEHTHHHRRVIAADASNPDLWQQINLDEVELVLLALTHHQENILVGKLLTELGYTGHTAAVVRFDEEVQQLKSLGFSAFNLYAEAGAGFAAHAVAQLTDTTRELDNTNPQRH